MCHRWPLSTVGILLAALPVRAQTPDEPDLDQIIVSGARTPITISQVGSATTVIGREEIERRQVRYVTDILRTVPGFSVSQAGVVGSQTQVRVRGAEANHVLVLIDGIRANDPASGDEFRWEHLTTGNIERIEVVRGAQSSLWGSDAISAVVHVITRDAGGKPAMNAYAESGSYGTVNAGANGRARGQRWSLDGGIEFLDTDGENIARTGGEKDGSDNTTVSVAGSIDAGKSMRISGGLRYVDAYSQFDPVDFVVSGLPTDGDVASASENLYADIGGDFEGPGGRIVHHLGIRYFDSDHRNLANGLEDASSASDRTTFAYQADLAIRGNRLSLALENEQTRFRQRGDARFGDPNQDQEMDTTSLIADWQALAGERFSWLLSARYDDNSDFDDIVTGRLAMSYDLGDATTLRGSIGKGQKNPTFTDRFGFFPGQFVGNAALRPEQSMSYEIGFDRELAGGAIFVQATAFRQDLEDEINGFVYDPATFLATAENTAGRSRRTGLELSGRFDIGDHIGLAASYTYTDSSEPGSSGDDVRELRRPRHAGSLSLDFRVPNDKLQFALAADYGGTRHDRFFPPFPAPPEIVTLGNYWLVDLTAQYRLTSALTLFARGTNLLDETYEQVYGYRTPGRAGYLGIRTDFGRSAR